MADMSNKPENIGVINPFALVEMKLKRTVNWDSVADHRRFIENVLQFPYAKLFDPQYGSPLYPGLRFDVPKKALVGDSSVPNVATLLQRVQELDTVAVGAGAAGGTGQQWVDPGHFFNSEPADFTDPVQGALPDCHFISALASLAWASPYSIAQRTRPIKDPDTFVQGDAVDMIQFFGGTGAAPKNVEVTELLPLIEPGNVYQYARGADPEETWPAVYEKAWVKWFTNNPGDQPDYTKVTGGDPIGDLVNLTGLTGTYKSTQGVTSDSIWQDVRSNCRGSWTFNPMAAWTYASAADAPTPINYDTAGLVAWHVYSILGWIYSGNQEYVVLRNPWGNSPGTLNVDNGLWTAIEQIASGFTRTIKLPADGVFALRADTFQQYYAGYGWVS
jgi:hypothetical protein